MKTNITIEQLATALESTVWSKGDLKRIYLNDAGYNTKKMSTKAYIWQDAQGSFRISVHIECPSQALEWIKSQEEQLREEIESNIDRAIFEIEQPEADYDEYLKDRERKSAESISQTQVAMPAKSIDYRHEKIEKIKASIADAESKTEPGLLEDEYLKVSPISSIELVYGKGQHTEGTANHMAPMPEYGIGGLCGTMVEWPEIEIEWTFIGRQGLGGKKKVFKPAGILPDSIVNAFNAAIRKHMDAERKNLMEFTIPYLKSKLAKLSK